MKFLIIDASNLIHRIKHVVSPSKSSAKARYDPFGDEDEDDPLEMRIGLIMSGVMTSLLNAHQKFRADHVVMAFDSWSWRKGVMESYKANRAEAVTPKEIEDRDMLLAVIEELHTFFSNYTNVTVLKAHQLEADDLIARWIQLHDGDGFRHVIVSSDGDFKQLVRDRVELFHPVTNTLYRMDGVFYQDGKKPSKDDSVVDMYGQQWKVKIDKKTGEPEEFDPEWQLFEKCIRGDISDNIPSAWPRVRTDKMKAAFYGGPLEYNNFINSTWGKDGEKNSVRERFERNKSLVDLTAQPEHIKEILDNTIVEAVERKPKRMVGMFFSKFCGQYRLNKVAERSSQFASMLGSQYRSP